MDDLRLRRRVAVTSLGLAALLAGPAFAQAPDISGTYWATEYHPKIQIVGGGELPLTAAGKAAYEKNMAGLKSGTVLDAARKYCVPDGLPRVLATPYPFDIIQAPPGQVTMVHELNHQVRVVALDKPMPSEDELIPFPYYNGHSVGHFEGDTLVVEFGRLQRKDLPRRDRRAPHRRAQDDRAHPQDQPDGARGRHHHSRPRVLHEGLAGALRLQAPQRRAPRGLCVRRAPPRHLRGGGRTAALIIAPIAHRRGGTPPGA